MSNITFGPAELLRYMGMGSPESMATGGKRFQDDFAAATASAPTGAASLAMPLGAPAGFQPMFLPDRPAQSANPGVSAVAQAMMPTDPRHRQRLSAPGPQGMSGILGMAAPFSR